MKRKLRLYTKKSLSLNSNRFYSSRRSARVKRVEVGQHKEIGKATLCFSCLRVGSVNSLKDSSIVFFYKNGHTVVSGLKLTFFDLSSLAYSLLWRFYCLNKQWGII